jgi:hypothetical protein
MLYPLEELPGDTREKIHPVMRSSPTISLFSAQPELRGQPYSFAASVLVHVVTIGLLCLGILSAPKVKTPVIAERYAVRHLDLHTLDTEMERETAAGVKSLLAHSNSEKSSSDDSETANSQHLQQVIQAPHGPQTLVQPDIPKHLTLAVEIPVPTVVLWNGAKGPSKTLVAPLPAKPVVADVKPSPQLPNEAVNLADLGIAATDLAAHAQPVLPSTTSPLVVQGPKPTPPTPITTAAGSAQPTHGTVMSLSDKRMANGAVTLPPINESAASNSRGALIPRQASGHSNAGGHGNSASNTGRMGAGQGSSETEAGQGADTGFGQASQFSTTHILRQKDGRFGAVVVGSSLEEKYPETAELWSGRLAYTVYVPVGLAKSWILQYSLSRFDNAAAAGNISHIDAPWPYSIVRPNIAPGAIDADALMVHGIVNQAGHFEDLAVVFPPGFTQTKFVLNSLAQWQFRPARQNEKDVKVEILLIIPETL